LSCGFKPKNIRGVEAPAELVDSGKNWDTKLINVSDAEAKKMRMYNETTNSTLCGMMMTTNDSSSIKEPAREKRLTELFGKMGVKVKFIK
jgi:hypothetical protein